MSTSAHQQAQSTGAQTPGPHGKASSCASLSGKAATVAPADTARAGPDAATVAAVEPSPAPVGGRSRRHRVARGLTTVASPLALRDAIQMKVLAAANRFRVIRTFDAAAACFPERPYKAALSAAQRAMRRLVKGGFLLRYVTDRHQHVYGLTERGAQWLEEHDVEAASSVRRVSDMTNPEHLLWASFIVSCCEARGVRACTEAELLTALNRSRPEDAPAVQGLLQVSLPGERRIQHRSLRPDAVGYEVDGTTWYEIDRSKRGDERELSLQALFCCVGVRMNDGQLLRRAVVLAKTERIRSRALALARELVSDPKELRFHSRGRRALQEVEDGIFEVWGEVEVKSRDGRLGLETRLCGHVVVQLLPTWLPKVRIDNREQYSTAGWFSENYLPYRRPQALEPWPRPESPLLAAHKELT